MSSKYGAPAYQPASSDATAISMAAVTSGNRPSRFDPDNPVLWLVGIGALALGFVAISTHVRVGPLKASASV